MNQIIIDFIEKTAEISIQHHEDILRIGEFDGSTHTDMYHVGMIEGIKELKESVVKVLEKANI